MRNTSNTHENIIQVALVRAKKRRPQSTQPKETFLVPICRAVYVRFVLSSMSHVETIPPKLTPSWSDVVPYCAHGVQGLQKKIILWTLCTKSIQIKESLPSKHFPHASYTTLHYPHEGRLLPSTRTTRIHSFLQTSWGILRPPTVLGIVAKSLTQRWDMTLTLGRDRLSITLVLECPRKYFKIFVRMLTVDTILGIWTAQATWGENRRRKCLLLALHNIYIYIYTYYKLYNLSYLIFSIYVI